MVAAARSRSRAAFRACEKDRECASGDCHKGDGRYKNKCKAHKNNGDSCRKDAECYSGDCHKGDGPYKNTEGTARDIRG